MLLDQRLSEGHCDAITGLFLRIAPQRVESVLKTPKWSIPWGFFVVKETRIKVREQSIALG
jgi:hypothetical protein